jgi:hypothetical protein
MTDPFATPLDVAARWRPLTADESELALVLAMDAASLLRARFPGLDSQVAAGTMDRNILTMVVAGMVKRAMVAPAEGISQESEGIGPFTHSQTYANPMGNVFLTAADLTLILGYQPTAMSVGFTNTTTSGGGWW